MFAAAVLGKKAFVTSPACFRTIYIASTLEAARKGTREKARKKKVKVEVKKVGFIPHNLRKQKKLNSREVNLHVDDSWKAVPKDNVYIGKYYRWEEYSFQNAVECHRETHHPTMYNVPDAPLNVEIELNTLAEKANRFVDDFKRVVAIPHKFDHGEVRQIMVFAKDQEYVQEAIQAGATLAGGNELIKQIQSGEVQLSDYQYIIAHPNILPDLVFLRGMMKKKFPSSRNGTLATNLLEAVDRFSNGISYAAAKDEIQKDFGLISTSIGSLDMETRKLEENFVALLRDIDLVRPKRSGKFITRVLLKSPPSGETLKINPFVYINEEWQKASGHKVSAAEEELEVSQQVQ